MNSRSPLVAVPLKFREEPDEVQFNGVGEVEGATDVVSCVIYITLRRPYVSTASPASAGFRAEAVGNWCRTRNGRTHRRLGTRWSGEGISTAHSFAMEGTGGRGRKRRLGLD